MFRINRVSYGKIKSCVLTWSFGYRLCIKVSFFTSYMWWYLLVVKTLCGRQACCDNTAILAHRWVRYDDTLTRSGSFIGVRGRWGGLMFQRMGHEQVSSNTKHVLNTTQHIQPGPDKAPCAMCKESHHKYFNMILIISFSISVAEFHVNLSSPSQARTHTGLSSLAV